MPKNSSNTGSFSLDSVVNISIYGFKGEDDSGKKKNQAIRPLQQLTVGGSRPVAKDTIRTPNPPVNEYIYQLEPLKEPAKRKGKVWYNTQWVLLTNAKRCRHNTIYSLNGFWNKTSTYPFFSNMKHPHIVIICAPVAGARLRSIPVLIATGRWAIVPNAYWSGTKQFHYIGSRDGMAFS